MKITMKLTMKLAAALGAWLALAGAPAQAASHEHSGAHEHGAPGQPAGAAEEFIDAEVRAIDRDNGKLTLKHGPIPRYEMAAMTMVFRVADPALLSGLSTGDKVRFTLDKVNGRLVVSRIVKAP